MDFLKKHYEKILLGVMLAGLIGGLVFMIFFIAQDREEMAAKASQLIDPHPKPLTNLDLTLEEGAAAQLKAPFKLDFETTNKLLNPMEWQRAVDGTLIPYGKKTGPHMVEVTNITPLYTIVSLDGASTNETGAHYIIKIEKQAAPTQAKRAPTRHYFTAGEKSKDEVQLKTVNGPPENPDSVVLKIETGEEITVTKAKPYRRVDGYMADFKYDPEKKVFKNRRFGDKVSFGGVDYSVMDVSEHELILMDQSNQKKTSLMFSP